MWEGDLLCEKETYTKLIGIAKLSTATMFSLKTMYCKTAAAQAFSSSIFKIFYCDHSLYKKCNLFPFTAHIVQLKTVWNKCSLNTQFILKLFFVHIFFEWKKILNCLFNYLFIRFYMNGWHIGKVSTIYLSLPYLPFITKNTNSVLKIQILRSNFLSFSFSQLSSFHKKENNKLETFHPANVRK